MTHALTVRGKKFDSAYPLICVSLMGADEASLISEASIMKNILPIPDVAEWRADYFQGNIMESIAKLRDKLFETPIIFTLRSEKEGGTKKIDSFKRTNIIKNIVQTRQADLIDFELFEDSSLVRAILDCAKENGVHTILSSHDFIKTPDKSELINRLYAMRDYGADICKIAVMPQNAEDVLTLFSAVNQFKRSCDMPIIAISMGKLGVVSRISGGIFGSCMTFGVLTEKSAPGQIPVSELRTFIDIIHN